MAAVSMYSIGICDDDKVLCAGLEEMVYRVAEKLSVKVEVEVWYSGESLLADLKKGTSLELLFLDIELVRQNGVAVGTFIREEMEDLETHIVYISGKESYAMQLFRVQPLDFLIKPISEDRLREVLGKSLKQRRNKNLCFEYHRGGTVCRIPTKDILCLMSEDKKIRIVTQTGEESFYGKLKKTAQELPSDFVMIHQSYIVNQRYVREYAYDAVTMMDGTVFPISKPYRKILRSKIRQSQREGTDIEL